MKIIHGDCLEKLKELPENSIDSIVTDPPYGLSFMGKKWDYDVPSEEVWKECLRVLKPGGYLLAFAGTRTQHRMAVRIEDAGFEIRDMIAWVYGSGFPKSLNIGKVADKFLKTGNASWNGTGDSSNGALGYSKLQHQQDYRPEDYSNRHQNKTEITEEQAKQWEGWGTALKPALEPITVARKPLSEKTVAENVLTHGTGGLNIDGCRVGTETIPAQKRGVAVNTSFGSGGETPEHQGRWPANLIHDGSEEVVELFPSHKPHKMVRNRTDGARHFNNNGEDTGYETVGSIDDPGGSAARFFYCAKASKKDRDEGLEGFIAKERVRQGLAGEKDNTFSRNSHPTVKPTALMRYLVKLVTPPGGTVLDPFTGSGSTGKACKLEGFEFIGIEREEEYVKIAEARIAAVTHQPTLV